MLNNRLHSRRWLAGDACMIADMICYPWAVNWKAQGQDIAEFPYFARWQAEFAARPAVAKGMAAGAELSTAPASLPKEEQGEAGEAALQPAGSAGAGGRNAMPR